MVEYRSDRLNAVFQALSDPTRREMLATLRRGEASIGELAAPFVISLAAASKHIKVLERAGLVRREVRGRSHVCRLDATPLHAGLEWLRHYERYWNQRLDALEQALRGESERTQAEAETDAAQPASTSRSTTSPRGGSAAPTPRRRTRT